MDTSKDDFSIAIENLKRLSRDISSKKIISLKQEVNEKINTTNMNYRVILDENTQTLDKLVKITDNLFQKIHK